jgi:hypothetical protein
MTTFAYYANIPNAPDNPSFDQPLMQTNSGSINSIIGIDHLTFGQAQGGGPNVSDGQHKQVTFANKFVPGFMPTDPLSICYTNSGTASTVSQMFYSNNNGIFQVSPIKAWGYAGTAGIISSQSVNVATVTRVSAGIYTVTLTTNAVTGDNFAVIASTTSQAGSNRLVVNYNIIGIGQFTLTFVSGNNAGTFLDPTSFSFLVMQI